jgi:DNA primase
MEIIEKQNLRELIFNKISSLDIYGYYMPHSFSLNKLTNNPFVSKDKNPSFIIGNKTGDIIHKAFNSEHKGDCISFVMQMYSITYKEALNKICFDFHLFVSIDSKILFGFFKIYLAGNLVCCFILFP